MESHVRMVVDLLNTPKVRKVFQHLNLPTDPEELEQTSLCSDMAYLWITIRDVSDSDEECTEKLDELIQIMDILHKSGRI